MNYYYDAVLKASRYIEDNLTTEIKINDIINEVGFSQFHFMRVFRTLSGHTISKYIKRRKITEAARCLLESDMRIIDIAILFGYNSQEAFTRAFKEIYNVPPNTYRTVRIPYKNIEQVVLNEKLLDLKCHSVKPIEPQIVFMDDFMIAGIGYKGKNENFEISKLWNKLNLEVDSLKNRVNKDICYGFETNFDRGNFEYIAGVEVSDVKNIPKGMKVQSIKRCKYAVFPIPSVVENVPRCIGQIYSVHLPYSGLRAIGNYDFEYYDNSFEANNENTYISFYIPVE